MVGLAVRRSGCALGVRLGAVVLVTGCTVTDEVPEREPPVPADHAGPMLVLDVVNNGDREARIMYETETPTGSIGVEYSVAGCTHASTPLELIVGAYRITIDGVLVAQGPRPPGMVGGSVTRRIVIESDGAARAVGGLARAESVPDGGTRRIGDCP